MRSAANATTKGPVMLTKIIRFVIEGPLGGWLGEFWRVRLGSLRGSAEEKFGGRRWGNFWGRGVLFCSKNCLKIFSGGDMISCQILLVF